MTKDSKHYFPNGRCQRSVNAYEIKRNKDNDGPPIPVLTYECMNVCFICAFH